MIKILLQDTEKFWKACKIYGFTARKGIYYTIGKGA